MLELQVVKGFKSAERDICKLLLPVKVGREGTKRGYYTVGIRAGRVEKG